MPRLSLYRPEKTKDYKFMDRTIYEQFQIGGTDIYIHKYLGPSDPANPNQTLSPTSIQDVLFLENRDRRYDQDIYIIRGHFSLQDIDFNLSQFGLFLQNDTLFLTVHITNSVKTIGRKLMSGDVCEIPILKDEYAANDFDTALKRFYVVDSVTRASEGFSAIWYPHLYRLKLIPLSDSQEFKDILNKPTNDDSYMGIWDPTITYNPGQIVKYNGILYDVIQNSLGIEPPSSDYYTQHTGITDEILNSTYEKELSINEAILAEAELNSPKSGYETRQFYTLSLDENTGLPLLTTIDSTEFDATSTINTSRVSPSPLRDGYTGYILGDGIPPNGEPFGFGIHFPDSPYTGDFFLRTDYLPNRLFRFNGSRWVKFEDSVRMSLSNTDTRQTHVTSFINNSNKTYLNPLRSDTFIAKIPYVIDTSDTTNYTLNFTVYDDKSTVLTSVPYVDNSVVKVVIDNQIAKVSNVRNFNNQCEFDILEIIQLGRTINWTIYRDQIDERQGLSKVLKFKPQADN